MNRIEEIWKKEPIKCEFTDFGESQSELIKTKAVIMTNSRDFSRGTRTFMAPKIMPPGIKQAKLSTAGIRCLRQLIIGSGFDIL